MIVVDAHQDIAFNDLNFNRDYRRSALETRRIEGGRNPMGVATLGLPDAILGRVAVAFATLFATPLAAVQKLSLEIPFYQNPQEAFDQAQRQMDYYERLTDDNERLGLIRTQADLDDLLATWGDDTDIADHRQGLVILMEGADPIIEPAQFEEWYERGVRAVGTAWSETRYSGGTGVPGPLTDLGRELLEVLADFNAILDLSHMAEAAFLESLDRYDGAIIASHSNPRQFCDSDRHLSDHMIRQLAERDGVMGLVISNSFLSNTWSKGDPRADIPLAVVADAIDHVCQITGSPAHVGIGSDLDGGFGAESIPDGLDTVGDLWSIGGVLRERGYSEEDIAAVLGGNMLRKLRQSLPD